MSTVEVQAPPGCGSADVMEKGEIVRMLPAVRAVLTGAVCAVVALTGCSVSVEPKEDPTVSADPTISKENLEQGIVEALEKAVGQRPDSVECPGPVKAKPGESVRCELSAGADSYGLTATVRSYDNGKAQYDVKVDDKPAG